MWGERTRRPRPKILGHIGRGALRMTRGGVASRSVAACSCPRLRDSSTTPRWLKSRYPQPSLIGSPPPEDAPLGPSIVRSANCLIHGFDRRM
jgi:hypothetical protein